MDLGSNSTQGKAIQIKLNKWKCVYIGLPNLLCVNKRKKIADKSPNAILYVSILFENADLWRTEGGMFLNGQGNALNSARWIAENVTWTYVS